jgi:hypothetical protein
MATKVLNDYCEDQGLEILYHYDSTLGFTDISIDGTFYRSDKDGFFTWAEADKHTAEKVIRELSKNKDTKNKLIEITNKQLQLAVAKYLVQ